ncbi:MAG: hypothetical protein IKE21_09795 [Erysipelotrichaceae bacterium]|nr:hypothetical protein [Erysipelotrichaceae bacterium]
MRFTEIGEALSFVMSRQKKNHRAADLKQVLKDLGDPQEELQCVHITGTNGKGSFLAYLMYLLKGRGKKVGTFSSPHYLTHLDRIRINGENIPAEVFLRLLNERMELIEENDLGMFDIDLLIMLEWFREEKVDYALIEAGIGGRHDSTNILQHPSLTVITTVGMDHMEVLGPTLQSIAYDKAGIAREGCPLLYGELPPEAAAVVREEAQSVHAPYSTLQPIVNTAPRHFLYRGQEYALRSYAVYQPHNASLALEAFRILIGEPDEREKISLQEAHWPGRFEIVHEDPTVVLDGAHNPPAVAALCASMKILPGKKAVLFGALKRKQYAAMIGMLKGNCDCLCVTSFPYPQAVDPFTVAGEGFEREKDYEAAFFRLIRDYDSVILCGSLYFLSEIAANPRLQAYFSGNK